MIAALTLAVLYTITVLIVRASVMLRYTGLLDNVTVSIADIGERPTLSVLSRSFQVCFCPKADIHETLS